MLKFFNMIFRGFLHRLNRRDQKIIPKISPVFKFLLITLLVVGCSALVTKIRAQDASLLEQKQDAIKEGSNNERWTQESIASQATVFVNAGVGEIPKEVFKGQVGFVPGGMVGSANQMIASLYTPQASGIEYIAQLKDNLLGKPAYAQGIGIGFNGLQPILSIWRGFRNVVYLIASFLFVIIGIMIMLRVKISPQAVITIQSAIPQVIIALLLVTFSYAIAGLLIDLTVFIQSFGIAILYQAEGKTDFSGSLLSESKGWLGLRQLFVDMGILKGWNFSNFSNAGLETVGALMNRMAPKASLSILGAVMGAIFVPTIPGKIIGAGLGAIIMFLIITIAILIWQVKFFFGLIKCYVTILLKIILAPLEIALGAFPGSKMGFSTWMIDLVANLAVFPVSIIFLILINLIIDKTMFQSGLWTPSLINSGGVAKFLLDAAAIPSGGLLPVAIGICGLMLVSKLPTMIPEFVFKLKPSPWGNAIGEGVGGILPSVGNKISRANAAIGTATESVRNIRQLGSTNKVSDSEVTEPNFRSRIDNAAKIAGKNDSKTTPSSSTQTPIS